ncbi:MAG TPA: hypothetical protein VGZ90_19000 [Puia sp.]|jgi:hypothetical protein|nr:hypothetical protein [Puia sp.]
MKFSFFLFIALVIIACHNTSQTEPAKPDTSSGQNMTDSSTGNSKNGGRGEPVIHDTILFLGRSARWKKSPQEIYDGNYDSLTNLFIPCGKTNSIKVGFADIEYDLVSNCDTSFGSRVRLFEMVRGGTTAVQLPHQIELKDGQLQSKEVHFTSGSETIILKPAQSARVQQAADKRREIYIKKQNIAGGK